MSEARDYAADVQNYVTTVDEAALKRIARHCGISLRSRDGALVSTNNPEEVRRVREGFLKKKLALPAPDAELDAAIKEVLVRMKADCTKPRVTVYCLLAEHFGKLGEFA